MHATRHRDRTNSSRPPAVPPLHVVTPLAEAAEGEARTGAAQPRPTGRRRRTPARSRCTTSSTASRTSGSRTCSTRRRGGRAHGARDARPAPAGRAAAPARRPPRVGVAAARVSPVKRGGCAPIRSGAPSGARPRPAPRKAACDVRLPGLPVQLRLDGDARAARRDAVRRCAAFSRRALTPGTRRPPQATQAVGRVTAIVNELNVTLDMEAGGEIAENLRSIYSFMIRHRSRPSAWRDPTAAPGDGHARASCARPSPRPPRRRAAA